MMRALAIAPLVVFVATGCKVSATFHCADSAQCGAGGTCEDNTLCSFPDPDCASGASYGDYSGDLSGVCVGEEPTADAEIPDARADATPGDPCLAWTFAPAEFDPCAIPAPSVPGGVELVSGSWTLDGDNGTLTDGSTMISLDHVTLDGVAVVSVEHLAVANGAKLRVVGSVPVAIASWSTIEVDGAVEVNSSLASTGAGGGSPACVDGPSPGQMAGSGDGGSGGAGFGGDGGAGGRGDVAQGGQGGASRPLPLRIEGGCNGADNLQDDPGGPGGGGIALIARSALTVGGIVHAGGAGGGGAAPTRAGGGGGGSGGMIKLEASALTVSGTATLAANGGQGGGGSHNGAATDGQDGRPDASPADSDNAEGAGSRGGRGGARDTLNGENASTASAGGGGGGGGVGYIVYRGHAGSTLDPGATYSPTAISF